MKGPLFGKSRLTLYVSSGILYANVLEHSLCSIFILAYEDGTDRVF